jgi:hypothetical protein
VTAATAASTCPGRTLLNCDEKNAAFGDFVNWSHGFVLDLELFETRLPLPINNPALHKFWLFETSTAALRAVWEAQLTTELPDQNFEEIATIPRLPRPAVQPHGAVDRRTAKALTALMRAEQSEVLHLQALVTSMNRATEANLLRGRPDWVSWQMAAAARFASRTAADIRQVIRAERAASKALVRRRLFFGVGSADLMLAHRTVHRHGMAPSVKATIASLGVSDRSVIALLVQVFEQSSFGNLSFNLSQFFSYAGTISGEQGFRAALRRFAARVPPASRPPA